MYIYSENNYIIKLRSTLQTVLFLLPSTFYLIKHPDVCFRVSILLIVCIESQSHLFCFCIGVMIQRPVLAFLLQWFNLGFAQMLLIPHQHYRTELWHFTCILIWDKIQWHSKLLSCCYKARQMSWKEQDWAFHSSSVTHFLVTATVCIAYIHAQIHQG